MMTKQGMKIWIVVISLFILVVGTACTPIVGADGGDRRGIKNIPHVEPLGSDGNGEQVNVIVDEIELSIMESFPIQVVALVRGNLPDGGSVLDGISATLDGTVFTLEIAVHKEGDMCTEALVPFEDRVVLDVAGLEAGTYQVVAGSVSAEFTFDVDNGLVDNACMQYIQDLHGTVTAVEYGTDGMQVELNAGDAVYSVTISVIQAQVLGRMEQIQEQSEIMVSGPVVVGRKPTLIVAEQVTVLGRDPDYVLNLRGTVTGIEPGKDGITTKIETPEGIVYTATISQVTTEIVYIGTENEIRTGTPVWVSGELFKLDGAHIAAEMAVVNPM